MLNGEKKLIEFLNNTCHREYILDNVILCHFSFEYVNRQKKADK